MRSDLARLVERLQSRSPAMRARAAVKLWRAAFDGVDVRPALPALARALGDRDQDVRYQASACLRTAAERGVDLSRFRPAIAERLDDPAIGVARNAEYLLGLPPRDPAHAIQQEAFAGQPIGRHAATLVRLFGDGDAETRTTVLWALRHGKARLPAAATAIVERALADREAGIRKLALIVLARRLAPKAAASLVPVVVRRLDDASYPVRAEAADALAATTWPPRRRRAIVARLEALLADRQLSVRTSALYALAAGAKQGARLAPVLAAVAKRLRSATNIHERRAARAVLDVTTRGSGS